VTAIRGDTGESRGHKEDSHVSADPTRPLPTGWQTPQNAPVQYNDRRRRFPLKTTIAIVVLILLAFGADRVTAAITENQVASRFQTSMSLSGKPSVNIQGFPFLTQLAARDFHSVVVTGHNLTDGQLDLANINLVAHDVHINGTSSATVDSFTGSVTVTLSSIANAGGVPAGVTLTPGGGNTVKATVSVLGVDATATAQVTLEGSDKIHVHVTDAGGIPSSVLGSLADFTVSVPKLPAGVSISSVSVTGAGVQVNFTGTHVTLSQ
jgi:hypothetical protein